ncbi:N-acetyl sugar amidotransferase [archaeon]|jgi:N-acetyl sugar amidotransferase|nr:N-acetyl sugar amidotransferase [archaeon]MBT6761821.1 N-acetyl sugar amidotransferase [archaeon]
MKYCTRCLYPGNHPLNITFDSKGVCSGCRIHEEKDSLNWSMREEKLKEILNQFKSKTNTQYDCIIPVSGARDSYFIVHLIKNVYKMKPLLVTYNKQYNTEIGIRNLAYLRTIFDCDLLTLTVNPDTVKKITKVSMQKMASMYWHCIAGQTVFPVQTAVRFKIPLIIWGAHQGIDQVGMFSHTDNVEMTRKYRKEHDLMGFEAEDMVSESMGLTIRDLAQYIYPHDKEIEKVGVRGIYLNNFIRWDTKAQHEKMIKLYDFETNDQLRTFDRYNDIDCFHYSDIHDYIKFLKYGYSKVLDHACREIRLKRLTREEGIELVRKYSLKAPQTMKIFSDWLNITEKGFHYFVDKYRNSEIWMKNDSQRWVLKDSILNHAADEGVNSVRLEKIDDCEFELTDHKTKDNSTSKYTLIGRGYVDKN